MTQKLKKWFKKLKEYCKEHLDALIGYVIGYIFGIIVTKLCLKYCARFTYHGESFELKDGDFLVWNREKKGWMWHRPTNKD